jgi:hypothetical protein
LESKVRTQFPLSNDMHERYDDVEEYESSEEYSENCKNLFNAIITFGTRNCVYPCVICGWGTLKSHCDACEKAFGSLKMPYSCYVCNKTFNIHDNLQQHFRMHACLYDIQVCTEVFSVPESLKPLQQHVHIRKWPYSCDICQKSFRQ